MEPAISESQQAVKKWVDHSSSFFSSSVAEGLYVAVEAEIVAAA